MSHRSFTRPPENESYPLAIPLIKQPRLLVKYLKHLGEPIKR
jgi:hypothetical protein